MQRRDVPFISIVICTHNRSAGLKEAIRSLASQATDESRAEIIVVDNASTDRTRDIVQDMIGGVPSVRYVFESKIGLSHARNAGAIAARGAYVAYLDDDARAEPGWLQGVESACLDSGNAPAVVGGSVVPDWGGLAPHWLPRAFWSVFTCLDYGRETRELDDTEYLVGANLIVRRDVLLELGGFNESLGRQGTRLLSGEEAELLARIRRRSLRIVYAGNAVVCHEIPAERQTLRWLTERMFWDGASQPLLDYGSERETIFYARQVAWDLRRIAYFLRNALRVGPSSSAERRLESALRAVQRAGRLMMNLHLAALRARVKIGQPHHLPHDAGATVRSA